MRGGCAAIHPDFIGFTVHAPVGEKHIQIAVAVQIADCNALAVAGREAERPPCERAGAVIDPNGILSIASVHAGNNGLDNVQVAVAINVGKSNRPRQPRWRLNARQPEFPGALVQEHARATIRFPGKHNRIEGPIPV